MQGLLANDGYDLTAQWMAAGGTLPWMQHMALGETIGYANQGRKGDKKCPLCFAEDSSAGLVKYNRVRLDRFCEGHLAAMFANGHIVALLRRLKSIRVSSAS